MVGAGSSSISAEDHSRKYSWCVFIFANEELVLAKQANRKHPLSDVDIMISFDRYGEESIITHQSGLRTASDEFAASLEFQLELGLKADPTGSYTDSNEFAHLISECTNVSVGYDRQHTSKEYQDIYYLLDLMDALRFVEWDNLVVARDPTIEVMKPTTTEYDNEAVLLECLVADNVEDVAELLSQLGYTTDSLIDELQLEYPWHGWHTA